MSQEAIQKRDQDYAQLVEQITPKNKVVVNSIKAFFVGGTICTIGQIINNALMNAGIGKDDAGTWTSIILVLSSVVLTGFSVYGKITKFGGAGALVPITGFANSVAAPAIEFKSEGHIFGIGCKIFTIAGPVILYGMLTTWIVGLIYYIIKMMGVV